MVPYASTGRLYEVDLSLRTLRVELRFNPFGMDRIEVYYHGQFIGLANPANLHLNSEQGDNQSYEK